MTAGETPLENSQRRLLVNATCGNIFLLLGNISHWLKEGVNDAFAFGTVLFVPIGFLYLILAGYWLLRHTYLVWKEE